MIKGRNKDEKRKIKRRENEQSELVWPKSVGYPSGPTDFGVEGCGRGVGGVWEGCGRGVGGVFRSLK